MAGVDVAALIPAEFRAQIAGRPPEPDVSGDDWLQALPRLLRGALARWELTVDGPSRHGVCALVVPVRGSDGTPAALKVAWPHAESRDEHLALRAWGGDGAVALLAADPARSTLLLARLDADRDLSGLPVEEACGVLGDLIRRLDRPALPQLGRLSGWAQRIGAFDSPAATQVPRRLVQQARSTVRSLLADDVDGHLVHTDLHYGNVLGRLPNTLLTEGSPRSGEERTGAEDEWLAIDPKPLAAEAAFAVWPALHNRWAEMGTEIAWGVHSRLGWICDAAGIDEDRARAWALVRTVDDALDAAERDDSTTLTARIALSKALSQRW